MLINSHVEDVVFTDLADVIIPFNPFPLLRKLTKTAPFVQNEFKGALDLFPVRTLACLRRHALHVRNICKFAWTTDTRNSGTVRITVGVPALTVQSKRAASTRLAAPGVHLAASANTLFVVAAAALRL